MSSASTYGETDPRSRLSPTPPGPDADPAGSAEYTEFTAHDTLLRGQHFVVHHSTAGVGTVLSRNAQLDEYVLIVPDTDTRLSIRSDYGTALVTRPSMVVVPPGDSEVTFETTGRIVRLLTVASAPDLAAASVNATNYASPKPNVATYIPWPDAHTGPTLRTYDLDVPDQPGRFGRIWRCSTFMVNVLPVQAGARDPRHLSPHSHPDFEQCSLALDGAFVHHLRWPWGPDRTHWQPDVHIEAPTPSALVIPPPVIHTTEATAAGDNLLIDIFCPPRTDFSRTPGWVLNQNDYPPPNQD